MQKLMSLVFCLLVSSNLIAATSKNGGTITFSGSVVNPECHISSDTHSTISLGQMNSAKSFEIPFQVQFTDCNEGQKPNVSFAIYDLKSEEQNSSNISLELLGKNKQPVDINGKQYDLVAMPNGKNIDLDFSARYVGHNAISAAQNIHSSIIFVVNYH